MARNGKSGDGHRNGAVKDRSQTYNPTTEQWVKRDADTGKFMDVKQDGTPFKGVRKEIK
jgi:V8-like Glu-specific endopeptidase